MAVFFSLSQKANGDDGADEEADDDQEPEDGKVKLSGLCLYVKYQRSHVLI